MNNLKITDHLIKGIKQGVSFVLVGTMLIAPSTHQTNQNRDNHRYHELHQMSNVTLDVYQGVNIYVDKKPFTPVNVNGEAVMVFSYNGTTYLPIRAIASIFGLEVSWDSKRELVNLYGTTTKAVNNGIPSMDNRMTQTTIQAQQGIGLHLNDADIMSSLKDVNGNPVKIYSYNGTTYLPVRAISQLFNVDISWDGLTSRVYIGEQPKKVEIADTELAETIATIKTYLPLYEAYSDRLDKRSRELQESIMYIADERYNIIASYGENDMPLEIKEEIGKLSDIIKEVSGWSIKLSNLNYSDRLRSSFIIIDKIEDGQAYTEDNKKHLAQLEYFIVRDYPTLDDVLNQLNDEWLNNKILEAEQCLEKIASYRGKSLSLE